MAANPIGYGRVVKLWLPGLIPDEHGVTIGLSTCSESSDEVSKMQMLTQEHATCVL